MSAACISYFVFLGFTFVLPSEQHQPFILVLLVNSQLISENIANAYNFPFFSLCDIPIIERYKT